MIQELPPWHPVFIIWRCLPVLFSLNKAIYLSIEKNTLEVANFNFSMIFVSHKSHKQQWLLIIAIGVTFMDFFWAILIIIEVINQAKIIISTLAPRYDHNNMSTSP